MCLGTVPVVGYRYLPKGDYDGLEIISGLVDYGDVGLPFVFSDPLNAAYSSPKVTLVRDMAYTLSSCLVVASLFNIDNVL